MDLSRNRLGALGQRHRRSLADDLRAIVAANTLEQARASAQAAADRWRATHPRIATQLEEDLEERLVCLALPLEHRVRIRTTNGLERLNQELKRRTRVVRIFPNRASLLRLVTALALEQSEEWVSWRLSLDMTRRARPKEDPAVTQLAAAAD